MHGIYLHRTFAPSNNTTQTIKNFKTMSKKITITKGPRVETPDANDKAQGIVAFQVVNFEIDFYGSKCITTHDTKIMADGRQLVIDGCGYIQNGFDVSQL